MWKLLINELKDIASEFMEGPTCWANALVHLRELPFILSESA